MSKTLVSIVIPCFNSGNTLRQAVDSARAQTWPNIEVIIVDDGSDEENTVAVIAALDDVIVVRQPNRGLPSARNVGFKRARGEYVLPLDADDWLELTAVEELLRATHSCQQDSFVYGGLILEGEAKGILAKPYNFFEQLFLNQVPYCILIPKAVWDRVDGYDETMTDGYEDWEFNIRLASSGIHGCSIQKPLVHYRVSSSGMLLAKSNSLHAQLWGYIQRKHRSMYSLMNLVRIWWNWKGVASSYPLIIYFPWLFFYQCSPSALFNVVFKRLRNYSKSRRLTRA